MTTEAGFWSDGSPIADYPQYDEVEVPREAELDYLSMMPDLTPRPFEPVTDGFPSRYEFLEQIARDIDSSQSWQFLVANREGGEFDFTVVSKGNIPLLTVGEFPGIEEQVTITSEDRETYTKMHVVRYVGDMVGLEIFVDYLRGDLDGRTEGDEDPIGDFRQRNPLWALSVFGSKNS